MDDITPYVRFSSRDDALRFVELKIKHATHGADRVAHGTTVLVCCKHAHADDCVLVSRFGDDSPWKKGVLLILHVTPRNPVQPFDPDFYDGTLSECLRTACGLAAGIVSARGHGNVSLSGA